MKHFTIAIDGPGGAGKSTVADHLAAQLGVPHLDTGAMYRAFGFQALQEQLDPRDPAQMAELATRIRMEVRFENGRQHTLVNGVDVTDRIRTPEISMAASDCGTHAEVRRLMVAMQQKIASVHSMILDGRDIGTRVLPDATLKVFLTASPEVRARRRCDELNAKGQPAVYEDVFAIPDAGGGVEIATICCQPVVPIRRDDKPACAFVKLRIMQLETGKIKPVGSLADEHGVKPAQAHGAPEVFTAGSEDVTHKNSPAGTIPSAGLAEKVKFNGVERIGA